MTQPNPLQVPLGGLHLGSSFEDQPPLTTPDAQNVRDYDMRTQRRRLSQRPGLDRMLTTDCASAVRAITGATVKPVTVSVAVNTTPLDEDFDAAAGGTTRDDGTSFSATADGTWDIYLTAIGATPTLTGAEDPNSQKRFVAIGEALNSTPLYPRVHQNSATEGLYIDGSNDCLCDVDIRDRYKWDGTSGYTSTTAGAWMPARVALSTGQTFKPLSENRRLEMEYTLNSVANIKTAIDAAMDNSPTHTVNGTSDSGISNVLPVAAVGFVVNAEKSGSTTSCWDGSTSAGDEDGAMFFGLQFVGKRVNAGSDFWALQVRLIHNYNLATDSGDTNADRRIAQAQAFGDFTLNNNSLYADSLVDDPSSVSSIPSRSWLNLNGSNWLRLDFRSGKLDVYVSPDDTTYTKIAQFDNLDQPVDSSLSLPAGHADFNNWGFFTGAASASSIVTAIEGIESSTITVTSTSSEGDKVGFACGTNIYIADPDDEDSATVASGGTGVLQDNTDTCVILGAGPTAGGTSGNFYAYFLDGTSYQRLNLDTGDVTTWDSAITAGSLPDDGGVKCRYATVYRNRPVLYGQDTEPDNWYMGRAGDWNDFDYTPATPSPFQPVAGKFTGGGAGLIPASIKCIAPYSADYCVFGGLTSLYLLRGDPADGGVIDQLTSRSGIVGPYAYALDPYGSLYFVGLDGLYIMRPPATEPMPLSHGRMDKVFRDINLETHEVRLAYCTMQDGLHIFITPKAGGSTTHYFWSRTRDQIVSAGAFWKDVFDSNHGPSAVGSLLTGDALFRDSLMLGGFDGHIRRMVNTKESDDGKAINSNAYLTPIVGPVNSRVCLSAIHTRLSSDSDRLGYEVRSSDTTEAVLNAPIRFSGEWVGGDRRNDVRKRANGKAVAVRVSNTEKDSSWSIEALGANVRLGGRLIRRGV